MLETTQAKHMVEPALQWSAVLHQSEAKCPSNIWRDLNWYLSKTYFSQMHATLDTEEIPRACLLFIMFIFEFVLDLYQRPTYRNVISFFNLFKRMTKLLHYLRIDKIKFMCFIPPLTQPTNS